MDKEIAQIEQDKFNALNANQDQHDEKLLQADKELQLAMDELKAATVAASDAKATANGQPLKPEVGGNVPQNQKKEFESATLSSFSAAGVGRTNIGGFGKTEVLLGKIEENTKKFTWQKWGG